jgi:ribose transport system permease protein
MSQDQLSRKHSGLRRISRFFDLSILKLDRLGALLGLLALLLTFSSLSPSFRQVGNLLIIATMASTIGIVAVGQTLVLLTGGIDLSVSSIVALTGLITASLMKYGFGPIPPLNGPLSYLAIGIGLFIGMLIGAFQGWLITYRGMPAFIVTLATMVGLRGISQAFSYGAPTHSLPDNFKWMSDGHIWIIPVPAIIMLTIFSLAWYILHYTKFGRYCFAIGGNETAARLSGIKVDRYKTYIFAISGLLASLSGVILMAYIDGAAPTNGDSYELYSVAAAIIGGVSLGGGIGDIWGTLIGVLIITVIPNGLIMMNALPWWRDAITGAIILIAVLIDVERRQARKSVAARAEESTPILTGQYMNEVLTRLSQKVHDSLGYAYCRIYLADRETGDLVPQTLPHVSDLINRIAEDQIVPGPGSIVYEAKETRVPVDVPDISHRAGVVPINPEAQSALALPIMVQTRVIGIIEVQSPIQDVFREEVVKLLLGIVNSMAQMLEDAWLLESGWLVRMTRDCLRHLWDDIYLGRSTLAEWALTPRDILNDYTPAKRGQTLRQVLLSSIERLKSPLGNNPASNSRGNERGYQILKLTYVDEYIVDEITKELHISRRQYFYDLKSALESLADALVRQHQTNLLAEIGKEG